MRIETTRREQAQRLRHVGGFHSSDDDLLAQLVPIAAAALDRGEVLATALRPTTELALDQLLGAPDGIVGLRGADGPDVESGQTLAARRARELRSIIATTGSAVTVLTEHDPRLDGADGAFWTELDAALNVALAELPVTLHCSFPELALHLEVLDGAWRNHPLLLVDGALRANSGHRAPREVLAERPAPAPALLGPPDVRHAFTAWGLHDVRCLVDEALRALGCGADRAEDIVLAVNEVATNAVEHGGGEAELCLWGLDGALVCEVHDAGELQDPLPGLQVPHPSHARGHGLWIARQLCDSLHVWADRTGTHVRMRAAP